MSQGDAEWSPVEAHLRRLGRRLWLVPHRRSRVLREARDHLLAATESGCARGLTPAEAEAEAVARFGPAGRITRYEMREAGMLWASVVAAIGALAVSLVVLAGGNADVQRPFDYHTGFLGALNNVQSTGSSSSQPYRFRPLAMSAVSGDDVWAVGAPGRVAWHMSGTRWTRVAMAPAPHVFPHYRPGRPRPTETGFTAVATPAPGDAWAVGWEGPPNDHGIVYLTQPLIEHWDGHAWQVSLSSRGVGQLTGVAAAAPDDVWAIGSRQRDHPSDPRGAYPLVEHWDGHTWQDLTLPWLHRNTYLTLVTASSQTDVWIQARARGERGVLEHWDGHAWTRVPSPFGAHSLASGLTSTSATDAWAVGGYARHGHTHPIAAHWDGHTWSIVPTPHHNTDSALYDVIATSPTNAWAVGASSWFKPQGKPSCAWCPAPGYGTVAGAYYTHWDGTRWSPSPAAHITVQSEHLTVAPDGAAYGLGECDGRSDPTFIVRLRGSHWTQVRTPDHAPKAARRTHSAQQCALAEPRLR